MFNQNSWDFQGGEMCLIFFPNPELHVLSEKLRSDMEQKIFSIIQYIFNMFFKLYRYLCRSLAALVQVKLPVTDLSLGFSGDLFSV